MNDQVIILSGIPLAIGAVIAERFRFSLAGVTEEALVPGRNLFANDMPERDGIKKTSPAFDPTKEPVITFYSVGGVPLRPSLSRGSKHDFNVRAVLRYGTVFDAALEPLEQLLAWMVDDFRGRRIGKHRVRGVVISSAPSPFQRANDQQAYCSATLKFLAVPA
jgi:hypothetical protein